MIDSVIFGFDVEDIDGIRYVNVRDYTTLYKGEDLKEKHEYILDKYGNVLFKLDSPNDASTVLDEISVKFVGNAPELINSTTVKFSPAEDKSEGFVFNFENDGLDKFYQSNETTFTGLFTSIDKMQPALHEIYKETKCPLLNEMMDNFAQRAVNEGETENEKQN